MLHVVFNKQQNFVQSPCRPEWRSRIPTFPTISNLLVFLTKLVPNILPLFLALINGYTAL